MKRIVVLSLLLCLGNAHAAPKAKLWVSVSVSKPVFYEDMTREAEFTFMFVNDGSETASLDWATARLFINKQEIKDWSEHVKIFRKPFEDYTGGFGDYPSFNRDTKEPLAVGQSLKLSADFGGYFERPGTYTLNWQISNVKAPPITFRVVPAEEPLLEIVKFVRFVRSQLPPGWRVFYSPYQPLWRHDYPQADARITVEHIAPVPIVLLDDITRYSPLGEDDEDDRANRAKRAEQVVKARLITKTYRPSFTFVVGPRIGTALYRDWKNENDHVWKSISEITKGVPQDHKGGLRPVTPEDKEKVEWSYRLHSLLHDLPYYYYEEWATYRDDMAPNMINSGGFEGSYHPQAAKVEEERYEIENKIYDLFPRYEEDKEVLKGQP